MARGIPSAVISHFKAIPLFCKVSRRGLRAIVQAGTEIDVPEGHVICTEGEFGRELYVIVEGTASVTQGRRSLKDMGPGEFFGELAFLDGAPRSATVTAKTAMTVMVLEPREMDVILEREPVIANRLLEAMATRIRQTERSLTH